MARNKYRKFNRQGTKALNELEACVMALEEAIRLQLISRVTRVIVQTDSAYIVNNFKTAMFEWSTKRWHRRSGAPVLNADLWKNLIRAMKRSGIRVDIEWVKGHSKDEHNRAVDRMARQSARNAAQAPLILVHVRRKLTDESVEPGSIEMRGQRVSIRIISTEHLKVQKVWKCNYEVISKGSDDYLKADIICSSNESIKVGHSYFVYVSNDTGNLGIRKLFWEIEK